jgi:hypothetical protein
MRFSDSCQPRRGLSPQIRDLIERYVDENGKADIDWADPQQRLSHLQVMPTIERM